MYKDSSGFQTGGGNLSVFISQYSYTYKSRQRGVLDLGSPRQHMISHSSEGFLWVFTHKDVPEGCLLLWCITGRSPCVCTMLKGSVRGAVWAGSAGKVTHNAGLSIEEGTSLRPPGGMCRRQLLRQGKCHWCFAFEAWHACHWGEDAGKHKMLDKPIWKILGVKSGKFPLPPPPFIFFKECCRDTPRLNQPLVAGFWWCREVAFCSSAAPCPFPFLCLYSPTQKVVLEHCFAVLCSTDSKYIRRKTRTSDPKI